MSTLLYIDDQLFDIDPKTNVGINSQINDIAELKDRQAIHTNSFKGLSTENNHSLLQYANRVQSSSDKTKNRIAARLEVDGTPYKGYIVCNGYDTKTGYDLVFYGGAAEFFKAIEDKMLSDIDTSDLDLPWDWTRMNARYGHADSPTFFVVDDGNLDDLLSDVYVNQQYFSLYISTIFERIITEAGFTFTGGLFDDEMYNKMILPFTNEKPQYKDNSLDANAVDVNVSVDYAFSFNPLINHYIDFDAEIVDANNQYNHTPPFPAFEPTSTYKCVIDFELHYHLKPTVSPPGWKLFDLYFEKESASVNKTLLAWTPELVQASGNRTMERSFTLTVNAGEKYYFRCRGQSPMVMTVKAGSIFKVSVLYDVVYGGMWYFAPNMPEMTQKEFIKGIMQIMCAVVDTNGIDKVLQFEKFNVLNDNKPQCVRIDPYIDHSQPVKKEEHPTSYAQRNYMRYKEDDNVTEFLGDAPLLISDNTLQSEKTLFTLPFAATKQTDVQKLGGVDVWEVLRTKDGSAVTPQPRILLAGTIAFPVDLRDGGSISIQTNFHYGYFINYNEDHSLGFDTLIKQNYDLVEFMLNSYCKLIIKCLFDANFMNALDHFIPLYSDIYNCYLYLNKVNGHIKGRPSTVETIRI